MELELTGTTALVTGASKGIGYATANQLAAEGANIAICARTEGPLEDAATEIESKHGVECAAIPADLTDRAQTQAFVETAADRLGGIDVLVNNAGSAPGGGLESLDENDWYKSLDLKLMGQIRCTTEAMPYLVDEGGVVVNIVGTAGIHPQPNMLTSAATNAADINVTKALAKSYGYRGVRVNAVNPGPVKTDRWDSIINNIASTYDVTPEQVTEQILHSFPLGRVCQPEEVANVVAFLASPKASYINGASITIDGGQISDLMNFDVISRIDETF
ncbi:SDR family NAD(P)-dependent oxidoreductase [Haladaptatus halobius]|uniref:SDR family NAD(P)-dependent oxidoreductase n=1 Tax=Haladaptatus halobius TaxID=2884875 RepID=UPI001D0A5674|nr:SDR family oxidoreductase [Haladaptatus halobius]